MQLVLVIFIDFSKGTKIHVPLIKTILQSFASLLPLQAFGITSFRDQTCSGDYPLLLN